MQSPSVLTPSAEWTSGPGGAYHPAARPVGPGAEASTIPLVSVCIPTYNGARWIAPALQSALAQTWPCLEIVVVDDASTDATAAIARSVADSRVRVVVNDRNHGLVPNWNRCFRLARGSYVKLLFQDDLLHPECVEEMARLALEDERIGLVFAPRKILLEDPDDPEAVAWKEEYGTLHHRFPPLQRRNRGRELFEPWLRAGFRENWVGEPSCALIRRDCVERLGGFNTRMFQGPDFEMWIRMMYFYDVGFLDRPLSTFRLHPFSTTYENDRLNRSWLDMLWLLEGLLSYPEIRRDYPQIRRLRWLEGARAVKRQWERIRRGAPVSLRFYARTLGDYLACRLLVPDRGRSLHAL